MPPSSNGLGRRVLIPEIGGSNPPGGTKGNQILFTMKNKTNQKLIILRGAPGTGKSTVAEKLRDVGKDKIWLHIDWLGHFFPRSLHQAHSLHYKTAKNFAEFFLSMGYSIIADGMFEESEWINWFVDLAKERKIGCKVFELTASVKDIMERDRRHPGVKAGWRGSIKKRNLEAKIEWFRKHPYPKAIQINSSQKSSEEIVKFILQEAGWKRGFF